MFGFREEEAKELGSQGRFKRRIEKFVLAGKSFPVLQHYMWWLIHNWLAHFMIGLLPLKPFFQFHDWTSRKLNANGPRS